MNCLLGLAWLGLALVPFASAETRSAREFSPAAKLLEGRRPCALRHFPV